MRTPTKGATMIRKLAPWLVFAAASVVLSSLILSLGAWLGRTLPHPPPRGEPTVVTTYYTEKSGRQCSQTVAHTSTDVAVSVSCSWPPAESRIADLLEGAGQ